MKISSSHSSFDKTYPAGTFDEKKAGGRVAGEIHVSSHDLVFAFEGGEYRFSLFGLKIEAGGAAERVLFFTHPAHSGRVVFSSDTALQQDPRLKELPAMRAVKKTRSRARWMTTFILLAVTAVSLVSLAGLWLFKPVLVKTLANQVPASVEIRLGDIVWPQLVVGKRQVEDAYLKKELNQLIAPLLAQIPQEGYPFKIHLIEDSSLNAFALPGGNIALHSGLVLAAHSSEEILGVLAHEISHVSHRHSLRGLINSLGLVVLVQTLMGDASGMAAVIVQNSSLLLQQKFSRDFESEADASGFNYLMAAKINPQGLIDFFGRLPDIDHKKSTQKLEAGLALLSTHPATQQRIEKLKKMIHDRGSVQFVRLDFNLKGFQKRLRHYLNKN